jgi:CRISPR-associated protein Cmr5
MMRRLDQERAKLAFDHVSLVKTREEGERKEYASIVHATPALLRSAGLSQALHFVASRKSDAQRELLEHLALQLERVDAALKAGGEGTLSERLLLRVREANMTAYLRLTREALACIQWYVRLVQGVLRIDPGETDGEGY